MFAANFAAKRAPQEFRPSRRAFLVGAAATGAGLTIGFDASAQAPAGAPAAPPNPFGAYVRIGTDNSVTVLSAHFDMGQGTYHGLATLVAEELDAAASQLRVEGASGNVALYGNLGWGGTAQGTGGSTAMLSSWERYRRAGAIARAMLVSAAAKAWNVPAGEIGAADGVLTHASGRRATFGEMADAAAREPLPANVALKTPAQWSKIGKDDFRRYDSASKTDGTHPFTIDIRLPGMLHAVPVHAPLFGATLRDFDAGAARAVPGVVDVVRTSRGVAVLARDTWSAMRGAEAIRATWDDSAAEKRNSDAVMAEYRALADRPGAVAVTRGDANAGLARAARAIEATYEFPYLAHASMEPLNAVVAREGTTIHVYGGHQIPDLYQALSARAMGVEPANVRMRIMKTGGGFGRRAVADGDVVVEAAEIAKAIEFRAPVSLQWTREIDMTAGRYRPAMLHKVRVGLDAQGNLSGWRHRIVGQSIMAGTPFEAGYVRNGIDPTSVEGVSDTPYALRDFTVELSTVRNPVSVLWWRAVGHTHTAYVMETMIDELATAARKDPVAFRRELLANHPKHLGVLNLAAERSGWGTPLPAGRFRGIAVHESFRTAVAMVAEIEMDARGAFKVARVVAAVDCGTAINPDVIRAQVEGGVGFGLGAILREGLTFERGRVAETNFDGYRPLRIDEMPKVEVHIAPSSASPTGIGEPGVPPIGPAVANALAAATGKRVRILPIEKGLAT